MTETNASDWRLIEDPASDGAWNMALDEALLESYSNATAPRAPTIRLYAWRPGALSLGRAQHPPGPRAAAFLRAQGLDVVRRPTGGQAVLHECERTYAVVGGLRAGAFGGGVVETYRRIATALVAALRALGAEVDTRTPATMDAGRSGRPEAGEACFGRAGVHEIELAGGGKVVGSAQLRRRGAFLQHGSIVVRADPERLARALDVPVASFRAPGELAPWLGGSGRAALRRLDRALLEGFRSTLGVRLEPGMPTAEELELATRLRCWKYDSAAWTLEGRPGARERCWGPPLG